MKAVLEFNLLKDNGDYKLACKYLDWALTVYDICTELRKWTKYGHEFKTADEALASAREMVNEIMTDHGVSLDDIE